MLQKVGNIRDRNLYFKSNEDKENTSKYKDDTLLDNSFFIRTRISMDKFTKAFTLYPAKGINGSKNSNFYEFLTMGTVPYILGSITLMSIFNSQNKFFAPFHAAKANKLGNKMALGVLLYALFKDLSKNFINIPVKMLTGIDTEIPYAKVNYLLQENPNSSKNTTSIEYHKVGESVDFPRWDLLYGNYQKGEKTNFRYDKIAKKLGLGENLNDSDQEVKPLYKEVLVKSKFAKSISSYLWAATGVALAMQKPWESYFNVATLKFWNWNNFKQSIRVLGNAIKSSTTDLYTGGPNATTAIQKHAGKILLGVALLSTILGIINSTHISNKPKHENVITPDKECVVN